MRRLIACLLLSAAPCAAFADDDKTAEVKGKFTIKGEVVVYDTESVEGFPDSEIDYDDHEELLRLLKANPDLTTLELNSHGGRVYGGYRMADIVIDYELKTVVDGVCSSSCVYIFLGGQSREMTGGSRLGFHHRTWDAGDIQGYYDRWREDEGWTTLFDFASWLFVDTQQENYDEMQYYVERGVSASFAIETMKVREDGMWYPRRAQLRDANVLTR